MQSEEPRHPINYVARRCGLTTHAIRVWERRHGAVKPVRTDKNRRLYSDQDIERLGLLKRITDAGHSIGQIAKLSADELHKLATNSNARSAIGVRTRTESADELLERCREAVRAMDAAALERVLLDASVSLTQFQTLEDVVAPLMRWVGVEWHDNRLSVAQEHLASAAVRQFLDGVRALCADDVPGPVIVTSTPSGQRHEIGAQLAGCVAAMDGWRVVNLGADLPIAEIAGAARDTNARAVALGISLVPDARDFERDIRNLVAALPSGTVLIIGGKGAEAHHAALESLGARCVDSLAEFREVLGGLLGSPMA